MDKLFRWFQVFNLQRGLYRLLVAWMTALLFGAAGTAFAQAVPDEKPPSPSATGGTQVAPVSVDGRVLFQVVGVSLFPASQRASEIAQRIGELADDPGFSPDQLRLREEDDGTSIYAGEKLVVMVIDADAGIERLERKLFAQVVVRQIKEAVRAYREERSAPYLMQGALYTAAITAILVLLLWGLRVLLLRVIAILRVRLQPKLEGVQSKSLGMVGADQFWAVVERGIRGVWWLALLIAAYAYVDLALSRFPWTRHASRWLLNLVLDPLHIMMQAIAGSIPGLAFIAILFLIVRYLLMWLKLILAGIGSGSVSIAGFDRDWAAPTYQIARFGLIAFAVVVAYPYIPGSSSEAFKGVSVFVGVLFSIGSSSMLGSILAGYTLIFQKAFRVGDRVMIGEHVGDIVQIRQQVTIMRTVHSEEVVIPNATIIGSKIVNFSAAARAGGVMLHTSVTIGYDTPWRQVEAMLLAAAERTPGLLKNPKPLVLKKALEDFYVNYELNAYSHDAHTMRLQYSVLHQNILDEFNEHGVQIMSPHFRAQPEQNVLVPKENWFATPAQPPADAKQSGEAGNGKS